MLKNKSILLILIAINFVIVLNMAIAVTNLQLPKSNTNHSATIDLTCNTTINSTGAGIPYNVSFFINTSGGGHNSGSTKLGSTLSNTTEVQNNFSATAVSISSITDVLKIANITCYANNGTTQEYSVGARNVTIDNTNPTNTLSLLSTGISTGRTQEITWTSTDALSLLSTNLTVISPNIDKCAVQTSTASSDTSLQLTDTSCEGDYNVSVTSTDTAGNIFVTSLTFKAEFPSGAKYSTSPGAGVGAFAITDTGKKATPPLGGKNLAIIIVVILLLYMFTKKK